MRTWLAAVCLSLLAAAGARAAERGLVAHWSFDEGSGAVARDLTGHGHDAALKNVEWVPSPRGHAIRFDGKEDLAQYAGVESMILSGDMTLAVWVRTDSAVEPKTNRLIFGDTGLGVERNLNLRMDGYGYLRFEWADGKSNANLLAPVGLMDGSWKHVAVTADWGAKQATLYVDGIAVTRMAMPLPISKAPVKERLTGWFYNGFFQGDLDDIRLYSRALSEAEVTRLYTSQADVQVGPTALLFDGSAPQPRGVASLKLRNWSKEPRRVEVSGPGVPARAVDLKPGAEAELALGGVPLRPVWKSRTDLFLCEESQQAGKLSVTIRRGQVAETQQASLASHRYLEPLRVEVKDPWQRRMAPAKTQRVEMQVHLALPAEQLRQGALQVRLVSRETGREALSRRIASPQARQPVALDARSLPWGAYDVSVGFVDQSGRECAATRTVATVLPEGKQQIRVLNNLASELMDARARGLLGSRSIEFMNPRDGWVWLRAAGECTLSLKEDRLLTVQGGKPAEAMRLLPAGKHVLQVSGTPTDLVVRAIPALVYNVYPSGPQIQPFGSNTWERLQKHTLPNTNMIESQVLDTPEYREWVSQGRLWIANLQAPGLIDKEEWTEEKLLEAWRQPRGFDLAKIGGLQVDEYYPGAGPMARIPETVLSLGRLVEDPAFAGKLWIPFVVNLFGNPTAEVFMKATLGSGWPYSVEVYVGEMPTEKENLASIRSRFLDVAAGWEGAYPGSLRRAIFTPMYAYLPYCTTNRTPQADFRVHLDMQMEMLATDPAFFGLWGVQPYRSNYVDEEILHCMGRMLRHYCIEGKTGRMLSDPYELRHATDPDFEEGTKHWQVAAAEEGAVSAGKFAGYGQLQGRYPGGTMGDTFLLMKRSAKAPNVAAQELKGLKPGRLYSLKVMTGDYGDLQGGVSRKAPQAVGIAVEGAEVLDGRFSHPFRSARGPNPFTRENPFWMTYHWLQFRAQGPTAKLSLSDWAAPGEPGGPAGEQVMFNFVEVQPVLENP